MTDAHEEKKTLTVVYNVEAHADRRETALYENSREKLFKHTPVVIFQNDPGRCFICQRTQEEVGAPLQSHHFGIERCFAEAPILWDLVKRDFPSFPWRDFNEKNPYTFVDDMSAQGLLLCEEHHIGKDTGIHNVPFPLWIMQRYLAPGYKLSDFEIVEHASDRPDAPAKKPNEG